MGFFSKAKDFITGGAIKGGLAGGLLIGGVPAIIGGALLGDMLFDGSDEAADAMRRAGATEADIANANLRLRQQIFTESAGARERADIAGEELLTRAQAPLEESEDFQRDLRESLVQQRINLGAFGLGDSTTFGTAAGRTTADLASLERSQQTNILSFLAGGAETGLGPAVGAQSLATQAGLVSAQSTANVGALKSRGQQASLQTGVDLLTLNALI